MEEEIIIPEEEVFDYKKLRYILTNDGYVCHASLGSLIICDLGECTEYKGEVPDGYETIEEWHDKEIERLNAWKIVDGNLVFDANRDYKLKILYDQQNNENSHVTRKELGMASTEEINPYTDLFPSHQSSGGYIVTVSEEFNKVGNLPTEEVNLSLMEEQDLDLIELEFIGNNFLPNTATSNVNNGITYTQNKDKTIDVSGTATEKSTLNLAGTDTSVRNILTFKENEYYLLFGLVDGVSLEFYKYDGTDRTLIGIYNGGVISFDKDTNITQIVLVVDSGVTTDTTVKPMLSLVGLEHPLLPITKYKGNLFNSEDWYATLNAINSESMTKETVNDIEYYKFKPTYIYDYQYMKGQFKENTQYTISCKARKYDNIEQTSTGFFIIYTDGTSSFKYVNNTLEEYNLIITSDPNKTIDYIRLGYAYNNYVLMRDIMLVEGSEAKTYQAYNGRDGQYYVDGVSTQTGTPTPDAPVEITNIYPAGTYNAVVDDKVYTLTIEDDLRSLPNGMADRLWLNLSGTFNIERKVCKHIFKEVSSITLYKNGNYYGLNNITNNLGVNSSSIFSNRVIGNFTYRENTGYITGNGTVLLIMGGSNETVETFNEKFAGTEIYYPLAEYTVTEGGTSYDKYEYEEYKNNTTLIDLAGNEFTTSDKITIKDNQIILIKDDKEIYLGDTVMPRTYTPYTNAYCHQKVYIDFQYKDPRNVDITKINLKGLISITNIETEYNFANEDLTKIQNYIMGTGDLTEEEIEQYDINGDGVITSYDYVKIKQMVEGNIPNTITGTLEINSTKSQRTLVLRNSEGKILTSLGLNGITTPSLSLDGGKVYGEFVLFNGETNEDVTLKDSVNNYEYIEIFYKDNGVGCNSVKIYKANNKKAQLNMENMYTVDGAIMTDTLFKTVIISDDSITVEDFGHLQTYNKTINNVNTTGNYIYIYRVVGYRDGGVAKIEGIIEPEEPEEPTDTPIEVDNTKTISANGSKGHHKFTLEVNEESLVGTKSLLDYSFKLSAIQKGWDWSSWGNSISYSITIGNNEYNGTIPAYDGSSTVILKSGSNIEIEHDGDGTKTIPISFTVTDGAGQSYTCGNASASAEMVLTTIQ